MDFKNLQEAIIKNFKIYEKKNGVKFDKNLAVLKLGEEVGEYIQAVLIHLKKCRPEKYLDEKKSKKETAKELADIVGMAIVNANIFDIDLEEAIYKKWISREWIKK